MWLPSPRTTALVALPRLLAPAATTRVLAERVPLPTVRVPVKVLAPEKVTIPVLAAVLLIVTLLEADSLMTEPMVSPPVAALKATAVALVSTKGMLMVCSAVELFWTMPVRLMLLPPRVKVLAPEPNVIELAVTPVRSLLGEVQLPPTVKVKAAVVLFSGAAAPLQLLSLVQLALVPLLPLQMYCAFTPPVIATNNAAKRIKP